MSRVVKTIASPNEERRVDFFERDDGFFDFVEMRRYHREDGDLWSPPMYWSPVSSRFASVCETLQIAEREARSIISWLKPLP